MIEDASVAIGMLRMVTIALVIDDGVNSHPARVPIPGSRFLKWVELTTSSDGSVHRRFLMRLGLAPSYFSQRIPPSLQSGTAVPIYPLLFEVGVDIRQWSANAGSNILKTQSDVFTGMSEEAAPTSPGLLTDEDDDVGVVDDDVLVQLNQEAFQLLNSYAFFILPARSDSAPATHPIVEALNQHIASSSGRMNHAILDEAGSIARQLGGGTVVFCKSGKDRTAMHVTFKQAQFINRYRERHPSMDGPPFRDSTTADAALLRVYGTRLPICEKNVGQALYAFNSLQVKFMPDTLKPPMNTLAGFLKGGKVFSGGGIET
jgi:hypothetical protein